MGASQNKGYHFGVPIMRTRIYLGSISGSPYFGKLPGFAYKHSVDHGMKVGGLKDPEGILYDVGAYSL